MKRMYLVFAVSFFSQILFAQSQAFQVEVVGNGKPILLIPGYSCSGEVWNETVNHLKDRFELHVFTLAGYAGAEPLDSDTILQDERDAIIRYVKDNNLKKPMLIGHSLGGFMTLWLHSQEPNLFGKSVIVDAVPFISALSDPKVNAQSVKDNPQYDKAAVIANFENLPNEGYIDRMTASMRYQVRDSVRARQIAGWSFDSDRKTLGSTIVEMSTTDLRQEIAQIKTPILILASTFGTAENSKKIYNEQYDKLPNKTIKVADSMHFIMYDQPEWFYNEIDQFLTAKK